MSQSSVLAAQRLLGSYLVRELDGQRVVGKIVETEAYSQQDAASHSYKGQTPRTEVMFGPAGFAYVYFTYGLHYCLNVVTGGVGEGSAVLIRALEPLGGLDLMTEYRHMTDEHSLTNGPAKLCQALAITKDFNGHDFRQPPLTINLQPALPARAITTTTRIGITKDAHRLWRFYITDNKAVSKI